VGGGCSDGKVDLPRRPHPGGFREGKPWKGQGTLLIRGIIEEGQWVKGILTGKWTYPDGRTLEGEFGRARSATATVCCGTGVSTVRRRASGWEGKLTGKISHRNGSVVEVRNGVVGSGTQAVPLA
jgi:hypothetical protein